MGKYDDVNAIVHCEYSNIGQCFWATLNEYEDGKELAAGQGRTRAEALHALADELE